MIPAGRVQRGPELRVEIAALARRRPHAATHHRHPFRAQPLRLLAETVRTLGEGDATVGAQHPVPGQGRIGVRAQDPGRQPRATRQAGAARDLAVAGHLPARDGADRGKDALGVGYAHPSNSNSRKVA